MPSSRWENKVVGESGLGGELLRTVAARWARYSRQQAQGRQLALILARDNDHLLADIGMRRAAAATCGDSRLTPLEADDGA